MLLRSAWLTSLLVNFVAASLVHQPKTSACSSDGFAARFDTPLALHALDQLASAVVSKQGCSSSAPAYQAMSPELSLTACTADMTVAVTGETEAGWQG